MSSLTFTFINDAAQTADHQRTFSLETENRFKAWLKDGPHDYWPVDGDGNPLPETLANYEQAFDNLSDTTMLAWWANVLRFEQDDAGADARDGVPPMEFD